MQDKIRIRRMINKQSQNFHIMIKQEICGSENYIHAGDTNF